jgi:hypothetical protein
MLEDLCEIDGFLRGNAGILGVVRIIARVTARVAPTIQWLHRLVQ